MLRVPKPQGVCIFIQDRMAGSDSLENCLINSHPVVLAVVRAIRAIYSINSV